MLKSHRIFRCTGSSSRAECILAWVHQSHASGGKASSSTLHPLIASPSAVEVVQTNVFTAEADPSACNWLAGLMHTTRRHLSGRIPTGCGMEAWRCIHACYGSACSATLHSRNWWSTSMQVHVCVRWEGMFCHVASPVATECNHASAISHCVKLEHAL